MSTAPRQTRGQALVLFSLTLLLLALMVLITLGIGMRAKERIETQMVADAAAYSNAVMTARTLNAVSVLNRSAVSHLVAMAGAQSLISYSGAYRASLNALTQSIPVATVACAMPPTACHAELCLRYANDVLPGLADEQERFIQGGAPGETPWDDWDKEAGLHVKAIQGGATAIHGLQKSFYEKLGTDFLGDQKLAQQIVQMAAAGNKWNDLSAPPEASAVSLRETSSADCRAESTDCPTDGPVYALSPRWGTREISVKAAMGSRGYTFVTSRQGGGAPIQQQLRSKLNLQLTDILIVNIEGSGRWGGTKNRHAAPSAAPVQAIGEDHGSVFLMLSNGVCVMPVGGGGIESRVFSSDSSVTHDDEHSWTGGADTGDDVVAGELHRHTLGACQPYCPGVWTMFLDLNSEHVADGDDHLWGQPKNYAMVVRDYTVRPDLRADPWNLRFNFRLGAGAGEDFDNTGNSTAEDLDLTRQAAIAAGLTYYHRRGHWKEPPNFFNPYWRATLVSTAIDAQGDPNRGGTDILDTLETADSPSALEMFNALQGVSEFRGWQ